MKLNAVEQQSRMLRKSLQAFDIDALSGVDAAALVTVLTKHKNCVDAVLLRAVDRAVATNRHSAEGSRSGSSWAADKLGVSEREARSNLATQKKLAAFPDVQDAAAKGEISLAKASAIGDGAGEDAAKAKELLEVARTNNLEAVNRRAQQMRATENVAERRKRLRQSQFVTLNKNADSMVTGQFQLLPEVAATLMETYNQARGDTSWQRAEDFAHRFEQLGKKTTSVVFHVDLKTDDDGNLDVDPLAELRGVGPVPAATAVQALEGASMALVGTVNNKLSWFSEQDQRKKACDLPEFIKRTIKRFGYDRCASCDGVAEQVDHNQARTNGGTNSPENLQPLCEACHHAKTKRDAPWTVPRIYVRGQLFPDTG